MITFILFGYTPLIFLFIIPIIVFFFTKVHEDNYSGNRVIIDKPWKKYIFCDGNIKMIILADIIGGWVTTFFIMMIEEIVNGGLGFLAPFIVFFVTQIFHYINFITATQNRIKLKGFCMAFAIPDIYVFSLGLLACIPAAF